MFAYFSAVFFFSTAYFVLYCAWCGWRRRRAFLSAQLVLPSVAYGLIWTAGMTLLFVANRILSQTVSFPIAARVSLWIFWLYCGREFTENIIVKMGKTEKSIRKVCL